mmetsp:Transcript_30579/g.97764  ORF Transcript_30579/g.97764 Transcript_30579/m.97764 type:complete len:206 (+) Transcript_30579:789-1406(+)
MASQSWCCCCTRPSLGSPQRPCCCWTTSPTRWRGTWPCSSCTWSGCCCCPKTPGRASTQRPWPRLAPPRWAWLASPGRPRGKGGARWSCRSSSSGRRSWTSGRGAWRGARARSCPTARCSRSSWPRGFRGGRAATRTTCCSRCWRDDLQGKRPKGCPVPTGASCRRPTCCPSSGGTAPRPCEGPPRPSTRTSRKRSSSRRWENCT